MTIISAQLPLHFQEAHRTADHRQTTARVQLEGAAVLRGAANAHIHAADTASGEGMQVSYQGAAHGMDLGALLPAREDMVMQGPVSGTQRAYADAIEAMGEEIPVPFGAYHGDADYSLNP